MLEKLECAKKKTVGTKQTMKAVQSGKAKIVFLAEDADNHVTNPIYDLCKAKGVEVIKVTSMMEVGKACKIEVGSAVAAILKD